MADTSMVCSEIVDQLFFANQLGVEGKEGGKYRAYTDGLWMSSFFHEAYLLTSSQVSASKSKSEDAVIDILYNNER